MLKTWASSSRSSSSHYVNSKSVKAFCSTPFLFDINPLHYHTTVGELDVNTIFSTQIKRLYSFSVKFLSHLASSAKESLETEATRDANQENELLAKRVTEALSEMVDDRRYALAYQHYCSNRENSRALIANLVKLNSQFDLFLQVWFCSPLSFLLNHVHKHQCA